MHSFFKSLLLLGVVLFVALCWSAASVRACPFCGAMNATYSEEIAQADLAVFVELVSRPLQTKEPSDPTSDEIPKATFAVTKVLKGRSMSKWASNSKRFISVRPKRAKPS